MAQTSTLDSIVHYFQTFEQQSKKDKEIRS